LNIINKKKLFLSVIIPTYQDWEQLKKCIDALSKQTYSRNNFEVIIVNNDPKDSPPELNLPKNFQIISEGKPGSYAARNKGVRIAKGDILAFTDSDCIVDRNWLENAIHCFHNHKNIDRIAGKVEVFDNFTESPAAIYDMLLSFDQKFLAKNGTSVTANMFAKREVFENVGLFDTNLMSGGDTTWGYKANEKGFRIIFKGNVVVKHPARNSIYEVVKKAKRVYGGHFLIKKWHENSFLKNVILSIYPLRPPIRAISKIFRDNKFTFAQKLKALKVLIIVRLFTFKEHWRIINGKKVERH